MGAMLRPAGMAQCAERRGRRRGSDASRAMGRLAGKWGVARQWARVCTRREAVQPGRILAGGGPAK
eukprot:136363-Chlamydomonas_euryale.AAC.1